MGFIPALTIVFIILKLCGVIAWSWLAVLSPLIIAAFIWLICISIVLKLKN